MNFVPPEIPVPKRNNISPSSLKFSKSFFSTFKDNFFIWPIWPIIIEINNTPPVVVRLKQDPSKTSLLKGILIAPTKMPIIAAKPKAQKPFLSITNNSSLLSFSSF